MALQPYTAWLIGFLSDRIAEDRRELVNDPPRGLGYACLGPRMVREISALDVIIGRHQPEPLRYVAADRCPRCAGPWPCREIRVIAEIWSGHPDWRPLPP